jgi:hypothetical protein
MHLAAEQIPRSVKPQTASFVSGGWIKICGGGAVGK